MFHSSVLGDPGSEWEREGCDGFRFPTTPQRGSAGISQAFWNPLSNCPPCTDGEIEALSREGFAKVTGEAGSPGLGLLGPWRSPVQPSLGPAAARPYQLPQRLQALPRVFNAIGLDEVIVFV